MTYLDLNAEVNLWDAAGRLQLHKDKEAARQYFREHVNENTVFFHDLEEKTEYLIENGYWNREVIEKYPFEDFKALMKYTYGFKHRFDSLLGALKFYSSYALKNRDGSRYLERFEDRVVLNAVAYSEDIEHAYDLAKAIITKRYQPATPTFMNAGRENWGAPVSCFPAGTPVMTPNGYRDIDTLEQGDQVISSDGKAHRVEGRKKSTSDTAGVTISSVGGNSFSATDEHPILIKTDREIERVLEGDGDSPDEGVFWVQAKDVEVDDYLLQPIEREVRQPFTINLLDYNTDPQVELHEGKLKKRNASKRGVNSVFSQVFKEVNNEIEESYDLGLIVGWYIAEGYCSTRNNDGKVNSVIFTLGEHEPDNIRELKSAFERVFGTELLTAEARNDGSVKLVANSVVLAKFFTEKIGRISKEMRLSSDLLSAGEEFSLGLIIGAARGDGCTANGAMQIDIVNSDIIAQLRHLISSFEVHSRLRMYINAAGSKTYQVSIPGLPGNNEELILEIGKNIGGYFGLRSKWISNYSRTKDYLGYRVKEVKPAELEGAEVFNLEVADTHNYIVESAIVHNCFLLRVEDNLESITRVQTDASQLSKRGGGVGILLSNIREEGSPIKGKNGVAKGVVPIMKILEDTFSYVDQLGNRAGAGVVTLNAHHPDIMTFLDTKRENADEKIRIKSLSLGVVIPDITFELAKNNEDMYLFSPYDVERFYGKPFSDISVTEEYRAMVDNPAIRKGKVNARKFFQALAEVQFESGYPYIMFEDTANRANPAPNVGKIVQSNLCQEIFQPQTASTFNEAGEFEVVGRDISCNLGSLNIDRVADLDEEEFYTTINAAYRMLNKVAEDSQGDLGCSPSIQQGNGATRAVGLGQMNLHGALIKRGLKYDSEEARQFFGRYMADVTHNIIMSSMLKAHREQESFDGFEGSRWQDGTMIDGMISQLDNYPGTRYKKRDWESLKDLVSQEGLYNQHLQAIPPTGSISYVNGSTSSIHPITSKVEARKEGRVGRVYYPAYGLTDENFDDVQDAYEIGHEALIDMYAVAQPFVDQGMSMTLFFKDTATTRDLNKAQRYAHKAGVKSIYYIRMRNEVLSGTAMEECVSCSV